MKWLKKKSKDKVVHEISNIYVVDGGTYGGDYMVLMDIDHVNSSYKFMTLPDLLNRDIAFDVFERGVSYKIVKFIEKLPKSVFKTCKRQYESINNVV